MVGTKRGSFADTGDIFAGETSKVEFPRTIQSTLSNNSEGYEEKDRSIGMRDWDMDTRESTVESVLPNTSEIYGVLG